MRVVDVHVHLSAAPLARAVRAALASSYGWVLPWPVEPEEVLGEIRAAGADLCVHLPYAHRPGVAARMNLQGAALAAAHPSVLSFATVHPDDENPVGLLEEAVAAGCGGLKVHCVVQQSAPDDPRMEPVYAWCEREGFPVLMHAGHGPDAHVATAGVERFAILLARHPRLRVCVAHLGAPEAAGFLDLVPRHEGLFLDLAGMTARVDRAGATVERVVATYDRILFGSDYPNIEVHVSRAIPDLVATGIEGRALAAILGGNAARFLGLAPDPAGSPGSEPEHG